MSTPRDPFDPPAGGWSFDGVEDDTARRLRMSLARHAAEAPDGGLLAERILHAVDREPAPVRPHRRRIGWVAPLAAAAVLIVLAGVVVALTQFGSSGGRHVAGTQGPLVSGTRPASPGATASGRASTSTAPSPPTNMVVPASETPATKLSGVRIQDVTFYQQDAGWAIGTATCSSGRCTAVFHTTDGTTWQSRGGNFGFNVTGVSNGCTTRCVTNIRFGDSDTGYAYGPTAFFTTTNGGADWSEQAGGAIALESANEDVIRVTSAGDGCPGPCGIAVQTADLGSNHWTTRTLPRAADAAADKVYLSRGGSDAYLLVTRNTAGGADDATSTLYRSRDDGTTWTSAGEPCPQTGGEADSTSVAAGMDGEVAVLCTTRQAPSRSFVALSTDEGATFHATAGAVPAAVAAQQLVGDPSSVLVAAGNGLARSTDGGTTWQTSTTVTGDVRFVGFESPTVGRAVTGDNTIWTTRNRGASWVDSAIS